MRHLIEMQELYDDAVERVGIYYAGVALRACPGRCPFEFDAVLRGRAADLEGLVAKLK